MTIYTKENMQVIIFARSIDVEQCPLAMHFPTALWPIVEKPALERLLEHLTKQAVRKVVVCSNDNNILLKESIKINNDIEVTFLQDNLPVGTAGCLRDAAIDQKDALLLVFQSNIITPPGISELIDEHHKGESELTVVFNPGCGVDKSHGEFAGIYVCEPKVLEHIPREGYFDIKEGLIPEMLRAGKTVHAAVLPEDVGNFRDWQGYLCSVSEYLESTTNLEANLKLYRHNHSQVIWKSPSASIGADVRLYGKVIIMDNARISNGAVILGPTVVGRNVTIGQGCVVSNSILWDNASVGKNCKIQRCVVDYHAVVPSNHILEEEVIQFKPLGVFKRSANKALEVVEKNVCTFQAILQSKLDKVNEKLPNWAHSYKTNILMWFGVGLLIIAFLWSYHPGLVDLWNIWQRSDEYSSGLLVPFLAVYILLSRRHDIYQYEMRPCLWGLLAFVVAEAVRLFGLFFMFGSAERLSIVLSIAALVLLLFGWQLFRKVSSILLFLFLMLPWPNRVQTAVALPLQQWATSSAVFCLEMIGFEVVQEGNIIHIGGKTVAVVEACNGLRMITAFVVISGLVVLLVRRAWWEKLIILASSLPIALFCNTVRLTVTAIAFTKLSGERWEKIFHDFGGYAMMPLALVLLVAELWLLGKLTIPATKDDPITFT
jgi:exosortase